MKILIVKRDKIGDMLLTTPAIAWLRQCLPDAEIHVLGNDYNAWVLSGNPHVNRVWIAPRVRHDGRLRLGAIWAALCMRRQLRGESFDWVVVGNGEESPRAIRLGLSVGGRNCVAYARQAHAGLSHRLNPPQGGHESARLAALLAPLVGMAPPASLPDPAYLLPQEDAHFAAEWLRMHGVLPATYVVIALCARKLRKKPSPAQVLRWRVEIEKRWGYRTLLVWTPGSADNKLYPGDDELAAEILAADGAILPFQGSLHQTLGIVWSAAASIIPDSGLMHFAAASPGGVVGLFADPSLAPPAEQWGPVGQRAICAESRGWVPELEDAFVLDSLGALIDAQT